MLADTLFALAEGLGFNADRGLSCASGNYNGYSVSIKTVEEKNCFIMSLWVRKGALTENSVDSFIGEYKARPDNDFLKAHMVTHHNIAAIILGDTDSTVASTRIMRFMEDITDFLQVNYYSNACSKCGSSIGLSLYRTAQGLTQLCSVCAQKSELTAPAQSNPNTYAQPAQSAPNTYAQPAQSVPNTYAQPAQSAPNTYAQPAQSAPNTYAQPAQSVPNTFAQPAQSVPNTYAQPAQSVPNTYAQPAQSVPNTFAQPAQSMNVVPPVSAVYVPMNDGNIPQDTPAISVSQLGANDGMEAISTETTPESTGYATAESLAQLRPPEKREVEYRPTPIPGDFRSEPEPVVSVMPYDPNVRPSAIPESSSPIKGIIGALLFSLLACAVWVLIGMAGRIMYLGGLLMGFCCVTGYKLFGKKFDVFGIISCIVVILLAVLGSNILIELITAYNEPGFAETAQMLGFNGFADTFFRFFEFIQKIDDVVQLVSPGAESMTGMFIRNLLIGYAFSGVGFLVFAIPQFKARNRYV